MIEIIRDPAWQFIGVLFALIAIIVSVVIYLLQRPKKRLGYELISENQLLTFREELEGKLKVFYEGQPATDICLLTIKLENIGNTAITTIDYEKAVSISTGSSSKVLSADVINVNPQNLDINLDVSDSKITISPILLNPKDSFTIKCLVSDFSKSLKFDARIVGVSGIKDLGKLPTYKVIFILISQITTMLGFALMKLADKPLLGTLLLVIGYIGVFISIFMMRRTTAFKRIVNPRAPH